jgi:glutamate-1-semialdehyde 2,1-aminomutase
VAVYNHTYIKFALYYASFSAQEYFGITPDVTTMGKVIGGGLPVGAYGGKREIMEMVAPAGPMYQAGKCTGAECDMITSHCVLWLALGAV